MDERGADLKLVERTQRGDKTAFDLLVRKYQHRVAKLVSRFVRDRAEIDDVTQEAFTKAYDAAAFTKEYLQLAIFPLVIVIE